MQLHEHPFFAEIQRHSLTPLAESADEVSHQEGTEIFCEGASADFLYLILDGEVGFFKSMPEGNRRQLSSCRTGDFFGEIGLLTGEPRALSAVTLTDTQLGKISGDDLRSFIRNTPGPIERILYSIIHHLNDTTNHYVNEMLHQEKMSMVGKMANTILHDFKNPFGMILLGAQILKEKHHDATSQRLCERIERQIESMTCMVNDLLDFSKGKSSLSIGRVDARSMLSRFREFYEPLFNDPQAQLHCQAKDFVFEADERKLLRALQNLVVNAIQSFPANRKGLIEVRIFPEGEDCLITVEDNGKGIPEAIREKLFEPFVTCEKEQGNGLGTPIVKSIVEAHGGTITFKTDTGVGTTFTLRLPASVDRGL